VKDPTAVRLIVKAVMKMISFFPFFVVMEHRLNEIDRGKQKYSGKNLSQCHFVQHKSHVDLSGIEQEVTSYCEY
jgi:hypothetical protein